MANSNNFLKTDRAPRLVAGALLLAAVIVACTGPAPPPEPVPPPPAAAPVEPAEIAPPTESATPAEPTPATPAPSEPTLAAPASTAVEPPVESMRSATPSAKLSVAADVRYQFDGAVLENQPVTLHLAVVPRVPGTNLRVSVKQVAGLEVAAGALSVQKVAAAGVYRQQFAVTRRASAPANMRVLVTMDMPEGAGFGFFSIPLDGDITPQKLDSVKQR